MGEAQVSVPLRGAFPIGPCQLKAVVVERFETHAAAWREGRTPVPRGGLELVGPAVATVVQRLRAWTGGKGV